MTPLTFWTSDSHAPRRFFKDRESVRACAVLSSRPPAADFVISARHPRGTWTPWRAVATLPGVPGDTGHEWSAVWTLATDDLFNRYAFADFRFEVTTRNGERIPSAPSAILRHYAGIVGFYGFGPVGARWSNADIRRVARDVGGITVRPRDPVALRRLAACIPPTEQHLRLYGYSLGGRAAVRLARWLTRRGVGVELLIGIDPVDLAAPTLIVPPNVRKAISFYQRNGARTPLLPGPAGRGLTFTSTDATTLIENHRLESWTLNATSIPVMHEDMPRALRTDLTALLIQLPPAADIPR